MKSTVDWSADPVMGSAFVSGRISAVVGQAQRDLQRRAGQAPDVFPSRPFDATLFATVSAANAFSAAASCADDIILVNRSALWAFAVDYQIDHLAKSRADVDAIVARCLAVAEGAAPADELTRFLAELRELVVAAPAAAGPDGAALLAAWCGEVGRMLDAMRREWSWRERGHLPSLDEYLANADNLSSAFVNTGHWIVSTPGAEAAHLPDVLAAIRFAEQVVRLLNDFGTYDRDVAQGDLNALMLHPEPGGARIRATVAARLGEFVTATRAAVAPLEGPAPDLARFLLRQIGFCAGFYGVTDYWVQW